MARIARVVLPGYSHHITQRGVRLKADSLSRAIGEAHRRYTSFVNFRQGVRGYLFQGRFFSCPLDEQHLLMAVKSVESNPVRAGLTKKAWGYRWSSARYHVGLQKRDLLVGNKDLLGLVKDWKEFLRSEPEDIEMLRKKCIQDDPVAMMLS